MTKKIVAIGGGENGRYLDNGKYREYEKTLIIYLWFMHNHLIILSKRVILRR